MHTVLVPATRRTFGNHVEEGDEVVAHGGRQLLRQPKVQQHQLQPLPAAGAALWLAALLHTSRCLATNPSAL